MSRANCSRSCSLPIATPVLLDLMRGEAMVLHDPFEVIRHHLIEELLSFLTAFHCHDRGGVVPWGSG